MAGIAARVVLCSAKSTLLKSMTSRELERLPALAAERNPVHVSRRAHHDERVRIAARLGRPERHVDGQSLSGIRHER